MRNTIYLLLLGIVFIIMPKAVFGVNETEPNGTPAEANTITLGETGYGNAGSGWEGDFWKITLPEDGIFTVTAVPETFDMYLTIFDANGVTMFMQVYGFDTLTVFKNGLAAGTYYIHLQAYYFSWGTNYSFWADLETQETENDEEPNNEFATALSLPVNSTTEGHINYFGNGVTDVYDIYRINLINDGHLQLTLSTENGVQTWLSLFDSDELTILTQSNSVGEFSIEREDLSAGIYYVVINTYYTFDASGYTLTNNFIPPDETNDTEPNDILEQAVVLLPNDEVEGHLGYYSLGSRDMVDIYSLTLPYEGDIELKLTPGRNAYTWCTLMDQDGTTIIMQDNSDEEFSIEQIGLEAGTYYIILNMYYSDGFTGYILRNEYTTDVIGITSINTSDWLIYPNPTSESINIIRPEIMKGDLYVSVVDMAGNIILAENTLLAGSDKPYKINLKNIASGNYLLIIRNDVEIIDIKPIVVQK